VLQLVNADDIARGLSAFDPAGSAIAAGRIMLQRLRDLARRRQDFAFETTLASRSFMPMIKALMRIGYLVHVVFLWLPSERAAIARVADRVRMGGHSVPEATIRRRYRRGLDNFLRLYRPLVTTWRLYDNAGSAGPRLVARGGTGQLTLVVDQETWDRIERGR
jgi:predicted ABC-type ATPase